MDNCEAWFGEAWRMVRAQDFSSIEEKLLLRCTACHGRVHFEKQGGHMRDRFEHNRNAHRSCSRFHSPTPPYSLCPNPVNPPASDVEPDGRNAMSDALATIIIGEVGPTERQALIVARRGQGKFRDQLIERWRSCSVTGFGPEAVLVASHIIPWCKCKTNKERLDVNNGLLLIPNIDKLFDRGLVTFDQDGRIRLSPNLNAAEAANLGVHDALRLRYVPEALKPYLHRHMNDGYFQYWLISSCANRVKSDFFLNSLRNTKKLTADTTAKSITSRFKLYPLKRYCTPATASMPRLKPSKIKDIVITSAMAKAKAMINEIW